MPSLQCRRILGGRNLVRVCNIVVAAIFDFMTVEVSTCSFREQIARSKKTPALPFKGATVRHEDIAAVLGQFCAEVIT